MKKALLASFVAAMFAASAGSVVITSSAEATAHPRYAGTGWEGYTQDSTTRVSTDFTIPNVSGSNGQSVAYWVGFGQGDPGIQQAGVTGTVGAGWSAWWEMWPSAGHSFAPPTPPHSGDVMQLIVTFGFGVYTLEVNDVTRGWSESTRQASPDRETFGEVICEAYDSTHGLPTNMGAGRFTFTNSLLGSAYHFPFGGTTLQATGPNSFYVSKP
jgi:hypothetical protein